MSKLESYHHISVMPKEVIEGLDIKPDGIYVDATMGGAGHANLILSALGPEGKLIVFDQDEDAWANAPKDSRVILIKENFQHLYRFLDYHGFLNVDGVLADLGVSSHHFDTPDRGFSTRFDGPLDMRMDKRMEVTAADIIANYSKQELQEMLSRYGEVRNSKTIAEVLVKERDLRPIRTIQDLKIILQSYVRGTEARYWAQVFQAFRMEVNQEIQVLGNFLKDAVDVLAKDGRLVVITFHSLEDRLVKSFFRNGGYLEPIPKNMMGQEEWPRQMKEIMNKVASEEELKENNRSRSARLRVGVKF
ncbi:MAG TPA: 16S rRNA (cytosine(1402)-N(4))-methyltransferase RsmH [Chitinophagaceae bacterium]|nr:16S rRNA (cytosine(1402)-N(4))-methyltransferase RsmH [Chitinophagaceae bacterium]